MVGYQWWSIRYGYKKRKRARQEPGRAGIKASATMIGAFGSTIGNLGGLGQECGHVRGKNEERNDGA
jgi:hypothetical protein